jgi:hypothetical protein
MERLWRSYLVNLSPRRSYLSDTYGFPSFWRSRRLQSIPVRLDRFSQISSIESWCLGWRDVPRLRRTSWYFYKRPEYVWELKSISSCSRVWRISGSQGPNPDPG